ncbi:MAG: hypothetical protein AAGA80_06585 [Cyanobacteria bacterium P01_F01_bin.143]
MNELLAKISSYNVFNYLLPGVLFAFLGESFTSYSFIKNNLLEGAFFYYFFGLVISRFGSLIVAPILKLILRIKYAPYKEFISASKKDNKLDILSEQNNVYRTLCSLLIALIIMKGYEQIANSYEIIKNMTPYIILICLLLLFIFSYKKQTKLIVERVEVNNHNP